MVIQYGLFSTRICRLKYFNPIHPSSYLWLLSFYLLNLFMRVFGCPRLILILFWAQLSFVTIFLRFNNTNTCKFTLSLLLWLYSFVSLCPSVTLFLYLSVISCQTGLMLSSGSSYAESISLPLKTYAISHPQILSSPAVTYVHWTPFSYRQVELLWSEFILMQFTFL